MISDEFIACFEKVEEYRQEGKIKHKLIDILFIAVAATIANANSWIDVGDFAISREDWLRKYIELPNGIPSHDTFQRVFENIDGKQFAKCFINWASEIEERSKGNIIAIDGKTSRRSHDNELDKSAIHIVNAWLDKNGLIIGQLKTSEKSNEITAVPELLELLFVKDCIITLDAMSCQTEIAKKIISKGADYVLALKENQPNLYKDVKDYLDDLISNNFKDIDPTKYAKTVTIEKGHGRIERREYLQVTDIGWLDSKGRWKNLDSIGMVVRKVTIGEKQTVESSYYISSLSIDEDKTAGTFAKAVRTHWGVESTHWVLDVVFKEDASRVRKNNGAENQSILKKIALNYLKLEKATTKKISLNRKRYKASMEIDFLDKVMFGS